MPKLSDEHKTRNSTHLAVRRGLVLIQVALLLNPAFLSLVKSVAFLQTKNGQSIDYPLFTPTLHQLNKHPLQLHQNQKL